MIYSRIEKFLGGQLWGEFFNGALQMTFFENDFKLTFLIKRLE